MQVDIINLSIPIFLGLVVVEIIAVFLLRRKSLYRLNDSLNDISCGILSQLSGVLFKVLSVGVYAWVVGHVAVQQLFGLPQISMASPWAWIACFVLDDAAYYFFHRFSHQTNLAWAAHAVHHQSEEYNLTVALRQSSFQVLFSWPFYLPIAFMGFPVAMIVTCHALNLIYQFWIHTRLIKRLGPLEWVMNTPSHHRVHHGRNPKYIDKNHAGVFIIWDRMFGTFQVEEEEPVYGVTVPLASWNPIKANFYGYIALFKDAWNTRSLRDKWRVFWAMPGWRPADVGPSIVPSEVDEGYLKYNPPVSLGVNLYALFQFLSFVPLVLQTLTLAPTLPIITLAGLSAFIILTLTNLGGLLELASWSKLAEGLRQGMLLLGAVILIFHELPYYAAGLAIFSLGSLVWLSQLKYHYVTTSALQRAEL